MKRKWLAIGIILSLIGVAVITSINANVLKTSSDGDLVVVVEIDKDNYQIGEPVYISIYVENHGDTNVSFEFSSTQFADYCINDGAPWSHGKVFIPMVVNVTLLSGGRLYLLNDTWNQADFSGNYALPGLYHILGWMVKTSVFPIIYAEPVYFRIGTQLKIETHVGLGVGVSITNVGFFNANNVKGIVSIKGGYLGFINLSKSFNVDSLEVNKSISKTLYPFGFGPIVIEITTSALDAPPAYLEVKTLIILFLIYQINQLLKS